MYVYVQSFRKGFTFILIYIYFAYHVLVLYILKAVFNIIYFLFIYIIYIRGIMIYISLYNLHFYLLIYINFSIFLVQRINPPCGK